MVIFLLPIQQLKHFNNEHWNILYETKSEVFSLTGDNMRQGIENSWKYTCRIPQDNSLEIINHQLGTLI